MSCTLISSQQLIRRRFLLIPIAITVITSCKDPENIESFLPEVSTDSVILLTFKTVQSGGSVTNDGGSTVIERGVCYSTDMNPVTSDSEVKNGSGLGDFDAIIDFSAFAPGETLYVRAYAINNNGIAYGDEEIFVLPDTILSIGQSHVGGIIGYLDSTRLHGLIVADYLTAAPWGCEGYQTTGASGVAIGTGNQNTMDIVASCTESGIAAQKCSNLILNGYSDWFLPSKDELNQLYINRDSIGDFSDNFYWSSSEHNNTNAWAQDFTSGLQEAEFKDHGYYVRPVRSF